MPEFIKYGTDPKMDALVDSDNYEDRLKAVEQNYGLDKLVSDKHTWVRAAVAKQGYGLDILINDTEWFVREQVARHNYNLNILANDEDYRVRMAVMEQGYGLNVFIYDKYFGIRDKVQDYLKAHGYKSIAEWAAANPDKVHNNLSAEFKIQEDLKDFIYKIDDSSKLKVDSSCDNIDGFFFYSSRNSNSDIEELIIRTVDTKQPIFKIQKTLKENKAEFKFIVDINNEDGDNFAIKTIIKSKEQLITNIKEIIEILKSYRKFIVYVDDLESCL